MTEKRGHEKRGQMSEAGEVMVVVSFIFAAAVALLLCVFLMDKIYR